MRYHHLTVAIPMLAELENLPLLFETLSHQSIDSFTVCCCVNNPEGWADSTDDEQRAMYLNNMASLVYLDHMATKWSTSNRRLLVIDKASPGHGWQGKQKGVGWARKMIFDTIATDGNDDELVVSLDADTEFSTTYLETVRSTMNSAPHHSALAVPYHHPLTGDESTDRAMLRYEIYMRHYQLSLMESDNPYAFTALGSAMVFPLWAYRKVGGITPLQGGEDFYLMQKFAKTGNLLTSCAERVYPQGRPSLRVPFGTGPAIAKGVAAMEASYPLYPHEGFEAIAATYAMFPDLYDADKETPMSTFLRQQLKDDDLWGPLRKNFKTRELFVHACQERVDGLRILQFLKTLPRRTAEEELAIFCKKHGISIVATFSFQRSPIADIDAVRNAMELL